MKISHLGKSARQIAIFIATILIAISCGETNDIIIPSDYKQNTLNFQVATILPQSVKDGAWNQIGYESLQHIKTELGAEIDYTDNVDVPIGKNTQELAKPFQKYAENGYDFIIGHGSQFVESIKQVAAQFPGIKFAVVGSYEGNNMNAGSITYRATEAGYLTGVVAALVTKTKKIGIISGVKVRDAEFFQTSYQKGAQDIGQDISVFPSFVGSFIDKVKATEIANQMIKFGVDVILIDATELVAPIIEVATHAQIKVIVCFNDQDDLSPGTVIASMRVKYPSIYLRAATLVQEGKWQGKQYRFGLREGAIEIKRFRGSLTVTQEAKIKAVEQKILLDKIDLSD